MSPFRIIAGMALIALALWPGHIAADIFRAAVVPAIRAGPLTATPQAIVLFHRFWLAGAQVYIATAGFAAAAVLLIALGLFIFLPRARNA